MAQGFSLKDHLFNADSLSDLAAEFGRVTGFDAERFHAHAMSGMASRELLQRLEWIADCIEEQLAPDFPAMAAQLEQAMPPPLDPDLQDDDFGRFIHAVPGILAVRHGLENHRERALDLLHEATKRFSMEFYIRPFLNRWPEQTLTRLHQWAEDENYHVRRLVSEGTRPKLPWAKAITLDPLVPLPLLEKLHSDNTRYVTRSVANHLNDIAKIHPRTVVSRLEKWQAQSRQKTSELGWMTRHALRTLVKQGDKGALALLGFRADADLDCVIRVDSGPVKIGEALEFTCEIACEQALPVLVDYILHFHRPNGKPGSKVFKLKQAETEPNKVLKLRKRHKLKGDATTFRLYPGPHRIEVQVNGVIRANAEFDLSD